MLAEWTSKWIKVIDKFNDIVIDDFDYKNGIQGPIKMKHCVKCIAINQCWFLDEEGKKPEEVNYGIEEIIKDTKNKIGLYHYNCHCKKIDIPKPKESDIKLIIPQGKIDWLFKDKSGWIKAMGHEPNNDFLEYLKNQIRTSYTLGKYYIMKIDNHGVAIGIQLIINGAREKSGKTYVLSSGWMVFSNGKLKSNTLIADWWKNEVV